jgi:N-acetylmuramoyl-L-alanine amidase
MLMASSLRLLAWASAAALVVAAPAAAQTARERYETAMSRESEVRALLGDGDVPAAQRSDALRQVSRLVSAYEAVVRRYPTSGYADNALWQGASLAESAYRRFGRADDRSSAIRLYSWLVREYPTSPLVKRARTQVNGLDKADTIEAAPPSPPVVPAAPPSPASAGGAPAPSPPGTRPAAPPPSATVPASGPTAISAAPRAVLTDIQRVVLQESVRITLELDREVGYHEERIAGPDRVFFDLRGAQLAGPLVDKVLTYSDDIVRQIRTGRHPNGTVRVVVDLQGVARYSVFTLYNPYRVIIDCERAAAVPVRQATVTPPARIATDPGLDKPAPPLPPAPAVTAAKAAAPAVTAAPVATAPAPAAERVDGGPASGTSPLPASPIADSAAPAAPAAPMLNGAGGFSLSRQLGLGVSRIVIDPGHGGHDPGASGHGIKEAELTLDVALRLEKLLQDEMGIDVVLTRRTNVYVPLEERTAIANREGADLFLSIHANASRNNAATGVETYFLSFAATADAEAVAARENSASERAMHNLPDIIKAIALNNKLDESRDLASMVQESMVTRLRKSNRAIRNLGVKKAPFVVLIGAGMPSVLAEISFLTNRQEAQLLKTPAYKQKIAEALHEAVMKYRRALKRQAAIADRP